MISVKVVALTGAACPVRYSERQSATLKLVLAINAVMFVVGLLLALLFLRSAAGVLQSAITELKRPAAAEAKVEFVKLQRR